MRIQFKLCNFKFKSDSKIDSFAINNKHKIIFLTSVNRGISLLQVIQTWKKDQRNKPLSRNARGTVNTPGPLKRYLFLSRAQQGKSLSRRENQIRFDEDGR